MDVSKYSFACQKSLHQGLQLAKSLGHKFLDVEHVAFALLRSNELEVNQDLRDRCILAMQQTLGQMPRHFGELKINFGRRLNMALDDAEARIREEKVEIALLWDVLGRQSSALKLAIAKFSDEQRRQKDFEPMFGEQGGESENQENQEAQNSTEEKPKPSKNKKLDDNLRRFTIDLTELAERGELDPVIGRDTELRRVLEILGRKKKNNPLLLGEPGVGKSAIAEALALRITEGKVPESMRGKRVLVLDLASLIAGARYRGEFEERLKSLLKALKELQGKIILFIDEIHMLVGAGSAEGSADAANIMKPALARGEILALGATTHSEFKKYIESDAALERRFQPLTVNEPDKETTLSILRGLKSRYEIHHGVRISDDALSAAVDLSVRYLSHRRLPDKAIDLMDEAASRLRLQIESVPAVLDELNSRLGQLEMEKNGLGRSTKNQKALSKIEAALTEVRREHQEVTAIWKEHQDDLQKLKAAEKEKEELTTMLDKAKQQGDFGFASQLQYEALPKLDEQLKEIRKNLDRQQKLHNFLGREVDAREIAEVISHWTGVPVGKLLQDDADKLKSLEERMSKRIFGQREAISKVARVVRRSRVGINDPNRPQAVFMFLGPTGVGKTELAKVIASEVYDDEAKLIRIDMSEYTEAHNVARLIGAPPGYVGFGEGGELTEAVKVRPYSVVLFDEVEKAHPRVLDIMLQLLDEGRLTDGKGRLVDFKNTFIVLTSNIPLLRYAGVHNQEQHLRQQLAEQLRPELVNRIDEVVVFDKLAAKHYDSLTTRLLSEINARLTDRELRVSLGSNIRKELVRAGIESEFGGRALRRAFETLVVDAVSERILGAPQLSSGAWQLELNAEGELSWSADQSKHRYLPPARSS